MGYNNFDNHLFDNGLLTYVPIFVTLVFIIVIGGFIFAIVKGVRQWSSNNASPRLTVPAQIVTKRINTWGGSNDTPDTTYYYVTFQVESGDRMELKVSRSEYGMLAEEDFGLLTFQGTRYGGFERKV